MTLYRLNNQSDILHAWRDPYLFQHEGSTYMLVASKSKKRQPTRKGTIGLLKSKNNSLIEWEILSPIYSNGWVSECDVPLIYQSNNQLFLAYTCWAKFDHAPTTSAQGGLHLIEGKGFTLQSTNFEAPPKVLLPESSGYYACRVIPELEGDLVGPDFNNSGFRRIEFKTDFQHLNKDFSHVSIAGFI